ncbi:MAG: DUF2071 domain-containing protein [Chthoniobacterales bacterium]|nr:DUF2071 domain-containing protein [Chthoniobacterales bacterium]
MSERVLRRSEPSFLQRHPFPMRAHFDEVLAVSFAFPKDVLKPLLPAGLELDTFEQLGFVTVALVWTRGLRIVGFPRWLGRDFFLCGYRIFARLREPGGRRLRGLKILRSETDRASMVRLGNLITGYRYRLIRAARTEAGGMTRVQTFLPNDQGTPQLDLRFEASETTAELPPGSPFRGWRQARQFAGPMPFTFSPQGDGSFVVIEGARTHWTPRPVRIHDWQVGLFAEEPFRETQPILANAFQVSNVDYRWKRGRIVRPNISP